MRPFEYATPKTKEQAVGLLSANWDDAQVLAGGTDLLALMKDDVIHPKRLVNLKTVTGMNGISVNRSGLTMGALARLQQIADSADVRRRYPAIAEAADEAASPQIRNMATLGGNLCQRPRCWYFRNGFGLLGIVDGKPYVLAGDNRYHSILGNEGPAYFVSPSSVAPVLIAYGAKARIFGPKGMREIALGDFYRIPRSENEREHALEPNEIVTEIMVPPPSAGFRAGYYEVRQKTAFDWPLATAAIGLELDGETVRSARVVLGQVAPKPWVSAEAAQALAGKRIDEQVADAAGQAAVRGAKGLGRNDYKIQLARVAVKRAILKAAKGGKP
jgi:xanthine dehydrogenase YagS FAD-binding subunit